MTATHTRSVLMAASIVCPAARIRRSMVSLVLVFLQVVLPVVKSLVPAIQPTVSVKYTQGVPYHLHKIVRKRFTDCESNIMLIVM